MGTKRWEAQRAHAGDRARLAAVLGRAFAHDPMWAWALGRDDPEDRRVRLERFFAALLGRVYVPHDLMWTAGDGKGAAVWAPPGCWHVKLRDQARMAAPVLGTFGTGFVRLLKLLSAVERVHLREPHYYLFAIGTEPAAQGRGIGSALLAPMLERCDHEGMVAYLESSTPTNLPFYRRHGFEATGELHFGDGVVVTPMRRAPARLAA
jgi:ribosomal protein S18 acetylase RimI-like enzyme